MSKEVKKIVDVKATEEKEIRNDIPKNEEDEEEIEETKKSNPIVRFGKFLWKNKGIVIAVLAALGGGVAAGYAAGRSSGENDDNDGNEIETRDPIQLSYDGNGIEYDFDAGNDETTESEVEEVS